MSNVIEVENLSKKYIIDPSGRGAGDSLRETLAGLPKHLWGYARSMFGSPIRHPEQRERPPSLQHSNKTANTPSSRREFWALKDVSFTVKAGERIGIIGRNGAGKSTLLKILARITEPTSGRVRIRGRVASLLEVGTGFHQELTGRENVYLSGAILGMSREEVKRKFDEIVDFSGVEEFIDVPVKRYSSGMYVRLAFSVAAHLEPEILLIDEALAVGDLKFQGKCFSRIQRIAEQGRTILLVSHDLGVFAEVFPRALLFVDGSSIKDGTSAAVIHSFNHLLSSDFEEAHLQAANRPGDGQARISKISLRYFDEQTQEISYPVCGGNIEVKLCLDTHVFIRDINVAAAIYDSNRRRLVDINLFKAGAQLTCAANSKCMVRFEILSILLKPDTYYMDFWIGTASGHTIDWVERGRRLDLQPSTSAGAIMDFPGPYMVEFSTSVEKLTSS